MLKGQIFLIDYVGQSNERGEPVGHSVKTLKENSELLDQIIKAEFIIPRNYEREFINYLGEVKIFLKYHSCVNVKKLNYRAAGLWGKTCNLLKIFGSFKEGTLWFVHPDFLLFVFLFLYPFKIRNKILVTMYMEGYNLGSTVREKIKNFFFKRSRQKVNLFIKNSKKINLFPELSRGKKLPEVERGYNQKPGSITSRNGIDAGGKEIYCPDYLYKKNRYKPYLTKKKDYILCTGVMNPAKDIEKLVKVWHQSGSNLKLKVVGFFPDKELYKEIRQYANEKIEIIDDYLTAGDYYKNIAGAKFSLLSYKKSKYTRRTSGILLESIFLDTPVIAPGFLLAYTDLPGIGYNKLEEIESILIDPDEQRLAEIKKKMKDVRKELDFGKMKEKFAAVLEDLLTNNV